VLSRDDIETLQKTLGDLYAKLNSAYWAASTIEAKDQIHGAIDVVNEVLDQLDKAGLEADHDALRQLKESLGAANDDLDDLKSQVNQIVHNVKVASQVVAAIDQAISLGGKVIAAV
jgi:methyl-accepting chemotaxis protein